MVVNFPPKDIIVYDSLTNFRRVGFTHFDDPKEPKMLTEESEDKRVTLLFEWQKDKQTWF